MSEYEFYIGQKVIVRPRTESEEYAVILWLWDDPEHGFQDAYIASWGKAFPEGAPGKKPDIWRYSTSKFIPYAKA